MHWLIKAVLKTFTGYCIHRSQSCVYPPPQKKIVRFLLQSSVLSRNYKYEHHAAQQINPTRLSGRYWN